MIVYVNLEKKELVYKDVIECNIVNKNLLKIVQKDRKITINLKFVITYSEYTGE